MEVKKMFFTATRSQGLAVNAVNEMNFLKDFQFLAVISFHRIQRWKLPFFQPFTAILRFQFLKFG